MSSECPIPNLHEMFLMVMLSCLSLNYHAHKHLSIFLKFKYIYIYIKYVFLNALDHLTLGSDVAHMNIF